MEEKQNVIEAAGKSFQSHEQPAQQHEQMVVSVPLHEYLDLLSDRKTLLALREILPQYANRQEPASQQHAKQEATEEDVHDTISDMLSVQVLLEKFKEEQQSRKHGTKLANNPPNPDSP